MRTRTAFVPSGRRGMTLLELITALAVSGVVLTVAWQLVNQLAYSRDRIAAVRSSDATRANGLRLLRDLISQLEVAPDSESQFVGAENKASFNSWCVRAGGWAERCRVELRVAQSADSSSLMLNDEGEGGARIAVWGYPESATLVFGDVVDGSLIWRNSWGRTIRPPLALALASDSDTLIFAVGAP